VKKEIENQQNLERIKFEKTMNNYLGRPGNRPGTANRSMMGSQMQSSKMSKMSRMKRSQQPASRPSHY
jgi:hypothetical protein